MVNIKKILGTLLGAFLFVLVVSFFLPSQWQVERSVLIHAPAAAIYPEIASFKDGWTQWSISDFDDPGTLYFYSGPDQGIKASRNWVSMVLGPGTQTITQADPDRGIDFELKLNNGFMIQGEIKMQEVDEGTLVTLREYGTIDYNPVFRWTGLMMDQMLGQSFEKNLATLKAKTE